MTDVSKLGGLVAKIASGRYPNIAAYAKAQAAVSQAQEREIRKLREEVDVLSRSVWIPPGVPSPASVDSRLFAYINYANNWPTAHLNDYKVTLGPYAPSGTVTSHTGHTLRYMCATALPFDGHALYGMGLAEARANGWVLTDGTGEIPHVQFENFIADLGSPGFRAAWCANVETLLAETGMDGFMGDDMPGWVQAITQALRTPSQYPTSFAYATNTWYDAIVGFCAYAYDYFHSRGKYVMWNAGYLRPGQADTAEAHNSGQLSRDMWEDIAAYSDGLMNELWVAFAGSPRTDKLRYVGPNWYDYWDEFRSFHPLCSSRGIDFVGLHETHGYLHGLCTFLLDWDGQRGMFMWTTNGYASDTDPWDSEHSNAVALGAPTGPAVKTGDEWERPYQHGIVRVNPVAGTSSITLT